MPLALADTAELDEIVVTAERRAVDLVSQTGNAARLPAETVQRIKHTHIHELALKLPAVWVSRGSGQESLTAIRSPVLTGAGSCGAFLVLEDGIPIRPTGFCNVNMLFEVFTEAASAIEVIRGPGNALYGSNALHGTINTLMPEPGAPNRAAVELGANDYRRVSGQYAGGDRWLLAADVADDGGFRADTGFEQYKLHGKWRTRFADGELTVATTLTDIDQETAGYILGEDAYRDPELNRSNPNPEAFRQADSQRVYAIWRRELGGWSVDVRPFLRQSDMTFLQHFLPGQPLEENDQRSAGINTLLSRQAGSLRWMLGLDLEWSDTALRQFQDGPTEGSAFLVETRPEGLHYDYTVESLSAAPYLQAEWSLPGGWFLDAGLRAETLHYDYDNRALVGNTRDDGTPCGFGGCLYTRPADRSDSFDNLAGKLGLRYEPGAGWALFASWREGFRAPQMTELYRLQSGQSVSDLDSETIDALEAGFRRVLPGLQFELSAYSMRKRNSVLRDADGFNVSRGRSTHEGVDAQLRWSVSDHWRLDAQASYGRHRYDFDLVAQRGETFVSGNDVDTAPRWMGGFGLQYDAGGRFRGGVDWNYLGRYYVDAENRFDYPGHELLNLNAGVRLTAEWSLTARVRNLLDELVADRADYAFGNYRYFPGRGREVFLTLSYAASSER